MSVEKYELVFVIKYKPADGNFKHVTKTEYLKQGIPALNATGTSGNYETYQEMCEHYKKCKESFEKGISMGLDSNFPSCIVTFLEIRKHTGLNKIPL